MKPPNHCLFIKNPALIFQIFIVFFLSMISLQAQTDIEKLKKIFPTASLTEKAKLLYEISDYYTKQNNSDSVIKYAETGLSFVNKNDNAFQYKFYTILSKAFENQANSPKVIYYLNLMVKFAEEKKDLKSLSELYTKLGAKYGRNYIYDKAIYNFHQSLEVNKIINDSIGISNSYKNIGLLYLFSNDSVKALKNLQTSLDISLKIKDKKSTAYTLKGFGNFYLQMNNFEKALKYQLWALKLFEEINEQKEISFTLSDIGDTYNSLKKHSTALKYIQKSLNIKLPIYDKYYRAYLLINIGNTFIHLQQFDSAYNYIKQAELITKNGYDIGISSMVFEALSEYYSLTGDYKNAFKYQKLYKIANDSIFYNQNNEKINQLKVKYEIDEFEKQNQLLKQSNVIQQLAIEKQTYLRNTFIAVSILITILVIVILYRFLLKKKANKVLSEKNQQISDQKNQLEEAYATKDKLFAIITHDLKNPFGTIISLAGFLEESYAEIDDNHKMHAIKTLRKSADSAYNLLENLTKWLLSQNKNIPVNKSRFDICIAINTIISLYKIETDNKNIEIITDFPSKVFVFADEQMIKTIIRNLLSNALKFTPDFGKIRIQLKEFDYEIHVIIADSGIGIKNEDKEKIFKVGSNFTTTGTAKEKGSGLGLILAKEFADRNNSKIWFESEEGKGSVFYFSVSKN
ncbi:MAG: tetratricopeptide repeat protein [Bacteroidetes bacterium]|nr:tetratricopeptide repeat protein [Bacteroidota bacterium]